MQTTKDRLLLFLKELEMGQKKFETMVGLSNGYVNKLKASPSVEVLRKIVGAFPQLNSDWLMTGEGEMLRPIIQQNIGDVKNSQLKEVNVVKGDPNAYETLLRIVEASQKTTEGFLRSIEKFQEQTDRFLNLLEAKK